MSKAYPSTLRDDEWGLVREMFEPPRPKGGRPRLHEARLLLDAILYVTREGCRWEALPRDFPPWQTVYTARRRWLADGTLERAIEALARAWPRRQAWRSSTRRSSSRATAVPVASSAA